MAWGQTRWKLWHLSALVLAAGLVFGVIRAFSTDPSLVILVGLSLRVVILLASLRFGSKLYRAGTTRAREWGRDRGWWPGLAIRATVALVLLVLLVVMVVLGLVISEIARALLLTTMGYRS